MKPKKHLIVVGGPTASGKTKLAIQLAQHYNTAIVSADSRQFYREMAIGTAKPTAEELAMAPHYFINSLSIEEHYSVGDYEKEGLAILAELFEQKDIVVLTGGSGLYINALCQGLDQFPEVPKAIKDRLEAVYAEEGLAPLQAKLKEVDPAYAKKVDLQNSRRLIRALSVFEASGQAYSWFLNQQQAKRFFQPIYIQLDWERPILYDRINRRVDLMVEAGLFEEVNTLLAYRGKTALATVGYQEIFDHLDGLHDKATAVELIKRNSRRYAKRQLTWMRRDGFWKQFSSDATAEVVAYIDWYRSNNYTLSTSYTTDKSSQIIGFKVEETLPHKLIINSNKHYDWAYLASKQNDQALYYLLEEWLSRSTLSKHYLFSELPLELFAARLGFLPIEVSQSIPNHLLDQLSPAVRCYRKEED
ncbi:MAG: hypothetical protein Sapg2KO_07450 [Saprospiraceae bacterium]